MNKKDRHRIESMRKALDSYYAGRLDLNGLISNIEMLQVGLTSISEKWRDTFRQQWGVLEQVYSVAVVRDQPIESRENESLIAPALLKMRTMLEEILQN